MPTWITWLIGFVLKGFGLGQAPDPVKQATDMGEVLGKTEQQRDNATQATGELERAQQGSADAAATLASHPDVLRRMDDPAASGPVSGNYD